MATPADVNKAIFGYLGKKTTFEDVKKLVSETTFTHNPTQVYGEDPDYDPDSFKAAVALTPLSYEEIRELHSLAKFAE